MLGVHAGLGMASILATGDEEQKERFLSKGCKAEWIYAFGLTEPDHGSDVSMSMKSYAKKVEGGYLINGTKKWIGNGTFADYVCVWVKNRDDKNQV